MWGFQAGQWIHYKKINFPIKSKNISSSSPAAGYKYICFFRSLGVSKPFPHIIAKGKMLSGFRIDQQHFMEPTLF